ncbi:MAG: hypothetical protein WDA06_01920 [Phenylobacterium sp.]
MYLDSNNLDIEYLHNVDQFCPRRQTGKTTAMLISAAHQADFDEQETYFIICLNCNMADCYRKLFAWAAMALDFDEKDIKLKANRTVQLKNTFYTFLSVNSQLQGIHPEKLFVDHTCIEKMQSLGYKIDNNGIWRI